MTRLLATVGALLFSVALLLLGGGLLSTLLALRASLEGFDSGLVGIIMSGYFFGFLVGTRSSPILIRRMGHVRSYAFVVAIVTSAVLIHALFVNAALWFLLRVVAGAGFVTIYTIIESWLTGQTGRKGRGKVLAVYMIVNLLALAAAQQLLPLGDPAEFLLFAVAAICICLSIVPIVWTRQPPPVMAVGPTMPLRRMIPVSPGAALGTLGSGVVMGAFWAMTPLYGSGIGLDLDGVALLMSAGIVGGAVLQLPIGRVSDHLDRRVVLMYTSAAAACSGALVALAGLFVAQSAIPLYICLMLYGGFSFALYPVSVALLFDQLEHGELVSGSSAVLMLHGLGAAVGPVVAGYLMRFGTASAFPLLFLAVLGTMAALLYVLIQREEASLQSATYVPMVRTGTGALDLVPEPTLEPSPEGTP